MRRTVSTGFLPEAAIFVVRAPRVSEGNGSEVLRCLMTRVTRNMVRLLSRVIFFLYHHFHFPGQLVGGFYVFTLSDLLIMDKPL